VVIMGRTKIFYKFYEKNKPVLLFLHGMSGDHTMFRHQIKHFSNDYSVLAVDLRGHGKSYRPLNEVDYGLDKMLSDILSVLKECRVKKPNIIGFSLGGYLALHLASRINTGKVIVINPALGRELVKKSYLFKISIARFVPKFVLKMFKKTDDLSDYCGKLELYAKLLLKTPLHVSRKIIKTQKSINDLKIKKKFYMIQSLNDEILNYNNVGELFDCEIEKVNGVHYVINEHPEQINKIIGRFLEK